MAQITVEFEDGTEASAVVAESLAEKLCAILEVLTEERMNIAT